MPIAATFEQLGGGEPVPLLDLVLHLLIDHRGLFEADAPLPLRDLLLVAGLDVEGTTVVRAEVRPAARGADPVGLPGLGLSSALAAERLLGAVLDPSDAPPSTRSSRRWPMPTPSPRWPSRSSAARSSSPGSSASSSTALEAAAGPAHHAAASFLRSRLAEWQGDAVAQEAALAPAVAAASTRPPCVDAAWFAGDRGDAREALALLRSAHVPTDDPDLELLARYTANGPALGRAQRPVLVRLGPQAQAVLPPPQRPRPRPPGCRGCTPRP